jgi:ribosomal protein S18 acetylase RimI-like enzyme
MLSIRPAQPADLPVIWALSVLPNVGETADPSVPFPLPPASAMPSGAFGDLDDPAATFVAVGGELLVAELDAQIAAMGGFRPAAGQPGRAEILRVRVHPARRRRGLGRAVMNALEADAAARGYREAWLGA